MGGGEPAARLTGGGEPAARLTGGGEPAGPPVRLGSPPPASHAQPSLIYATNFRSGTLGDADQAPPEP